MPISEELLPPPPESIARSSPRALNSDLQSLLDRAYGVEFSILDGESGELLHTARGQPPRNWELHAEMCREVARRGRPELIDEEDPLATLALPLTDTMGNSPVAVATFLTRDVEPGEDLAQQAELFGMDPEDVSTWARRQTPWPVDALIRVGDLVLDGTRANRRVQKLQREADSLSVNLASTYEEISLLYRLTQNLKLSKSDEDLGRVALEWMQEVVPASGLLIQLVPVVHAGKSASHPSRTQPMLLSQGKCPLDSDQFSKLIAHLEPLPLHQPVVVNRSTTEQPDWPCPQIREMIVVALVEGENVFGWLAVLNHVEGGEFGTVEASLLSSIAAILGIHGGNIELYRQQSKLVEGVVRALTSAIDAKDPYTCGHSDRVARVAVRLAERLGCDTKTLDTLYLAGMLHDIGKIGIDDSVLRKAGRLSKTEYEHIKLHVTIGHRILSGLPTLEDVLPVVLHHHESWEGNGYPRQLKADAIPLQARIVAVADAFDAMTSDRPYRRGLPDEKVDQVLRRGAGRQWDPAVVEAFFNARDDIRRIALGEDLPVELELVGMA